MAPGDPRRDRVPQFGMGLLDPQSLHSLLKPSHRQDPGALSLPWAQPQPQLLSVIQLDLGQKPGSSRGILQGVLP